MMRKLCLFSLLGLMCQSWLSAPLHAATLQIMSMPVECEIQVAKHDKAWVKKTTEVMTVADLAAGVYEVQGRFEGRTFKESVSLKADQTQTVMINFLVRDLSDIPVESPAQEALRQLTQAKLYHVENKLAQAWDAIQQAKTLYSDDPEIQDVYSEINTQRNRQINTVWSTLQQARNNKNRLVMLASLSQLYKLSPNHPGARQISEQEGVEFNSLGMMMLRVKAGRFVMGSQQSVEEIDKLGGRNAQLYNQETPIHSVKISQPYLMSATPITRGQFRSFIEAAAYITDAQRGRLVTGIDERGLNRKDGLYWEQVDFDQDDSHPVVCISYNDAMAFCQWLGKQENRVYHLPTEAQWEYAAKAGTNTMFWWGDEFNRLTPMANISDQSLVLWKRENFTRKQHDMKWDDKFAFTSPVASFPANPWGFYDMLGNVSEWCRDWQANYVAQDLTDPQGPAQGRNRIVRGGSWYYYPVYCRASFRTGYRPERSYTTVGFRIVRELK